MPVYDGKLFTVALVVTVLGVKIQIEGTVEVLDIRRNTDAE